MLLGETLRLLGKEDNASIAFDAVQQWRVKDISMVKNDDYSNAAAWFTRELNIAQTAEDFAHRRATFFCMGFVDMAFDDAHKAAEMGTSAEGFILLGETLRLIDKDEEALVTFDAVN
ncbi:Aste57867_14095 [Aphanomyces stellatus]|uniref:Aste57867_14095 protein n=1 Tax=Aphanomyces stellatus TaxID=120398 RepID=A0A485L053_9STRA|nr:hypothetical protein As57867_014044 [Aphanomyces stellatus]VFT90923.1 Aste57867_14095 [Aphanomyces stellatus]